MTIKAIYEDGVFKPKEKVDLEDKTEVELDFRTYVPEGEDVEHSLSILHNDRTRSTAYDDGALYSSLVTRAPRRPRPLSSQESSTSNSSVLKSNQREQL